MSRGSSVVEQRTENPCVESPILSLGTKMDLRDYSSAVERAAHNRLVAGSNPASPTCAYQVIKNKVHKVSQEQKIFKYFINFTLYELHDHCECRIMVITPPCQGRNGGSIPLTRSKKSKNGLKMPFFGYFSIFYSNSDTNNPPLE